MALKDLDMNNDGVVDLEEFTRWYFTGMKPYNGARRTMLKLGSKTAGLMKVAAEEAKAVMLGGELTTKHLSMSVGMNRPKDAQTKIEVSVNFGGEVQHKKTQEMSALYKDAVNK